MFQRFFESCRLVFFEGVEVIEPFDKQEISDLLDDFERVGNAAGPESVPDGVNLVTDSRGEHRKLELLHRFFACLDSHRLAGWTVAKKSVREKAKSVGSAARSYPDGAIPRRANANVGRRGGPRKTKKNVI